jgi:hypothetical protein
MAAVLLPRPTPAVKSKAAMRKISIVLIAVLLAAVCGAQQTGSATVKVAGCVTSINGTFQLITHDGKTYVLKGDHDSLLSYGDKLVEVTGTISAEKAPQGAPTVLHVKKLKKLADFCQ